MKRINIVFFVIFLSSITGCKKYLDKDPLDSINTANFFQTSDDAVNAINAAYQPLQRPKLYNLRMWTSDIFAGNSLTGGGGGTDGIETVEEANFTTDPTNAGVQDLYRGPFPGILYCNLVIQNVPGIKMDTTLKDRVIGEAKFLRAMYYFILVRYFGDVPLSTTPTTPDNLKPKRTPKDQVYTQITQDLTDAIGLLPLRETYAGSDIGRASRGSAIGLLAKVYLTLGNYQQALTLCQQLSGLGYTLDANYADNFDPAHKNSGESVFEVQYSGLQIAGVGFFDDAFQGSWTSVYMGPRNSNFVGGAYGWNQPTQEFVNNYEPGDLRKDLTVLYQGCPDFAGNVYQGSFSSTGYNVRKFLVPLSVAPDANTSPEDFPALRYADVLLMEAEAMNELNMTSQAQAPSTSINAGGPLNQVRRRAGLPDIQNLSQADLRDTILHERRMELAFEGQRWFDLIRINNGQYGLDFLHSIGHTNATTKNLLLPIPQSEIDANPNLTQNPGY